MFVDSHCHLSFPELLSQLPQIREAMAAAQVDRALCICTTLEEFEDVHALAMGYDNFWASAGVHPDNEGIAEPTVDKLLELAARPRVVGIGETGLDYYDMEGRKGGRSVSDMEWQRDRFRTHIRAARLCGKPLIIHTRSASDDTVAILREEGEDGSPGAAGVPLLHRDGGSRPGGAGSGLPHLVFGHPDLQDCRRPARCRPVRALTGC
jgi:TatD DNase family protein